jgi:[ribosomal protein S18]-alanine N-acetyltransferase
MTSGRAPAFRIRRLRTAKEARSCARLMAISEPWITLGRSYAQALKLLRDPAKEVFVAASKSAVLGFVIVDLRGPFSGYIQTIGVQPENRSRGIGRALIRFAERRILRKSPNVFLCVSSFNRKARKLYLRLKYRQVGRLTDYVVRGHSEILMRKTAGPLTGFRPRAARFSGAAKAPA